MSTAVCIVRFHDGTAKANWGGRATSLALARVAARSGRHVASVVNGEVITRGLGLEPRWRGALLTATKAARRAHLPVKLRGAASNEDWATLARAAREVVTEPPTPRARAVVGALGRADEVWVNGEGDLILAERATLYRTLLITHMAVAMGKPVRMTNSILSEPATGPRSEVVTHAVGAALGSCTSVEYRDPASLRLHERLYPAVDASWQPDALFAWAQDAATLAADRGAFGPFHEGLPMSAQAVLAGSKPFVALSGSSAKVDRAMAREGLLRFAAGLEARSLAPVVVATDKADRWMLDAADDAGLASVSATVPLVAGLTVLARAACFVSGRYHPSIMASDAGTPCVFMGSNSHKTASLQEVLGASEPIEHPFFGQGSVEELLEVSTSALELDRQSIADRSMALSRQLGVASSGPPATRRI